MDKIDPEAIRAKTYHHKTEMEELIEKCITREKVKKLVDFLMDLNDISEFEEVGRGVLESAVIEGMKAGANNAISLIAEEYIDALRQAVELIKAWHNMGVPQEQANRLWGIYYNRSPEMTKIRQALLTKYGVKNGTD